jgi:hypothetical protein
MKKLILPLFSLTMFLAPARSNAQALEAGTIIVDGYYGFGNLFNSVFKSSTSGLGSNFSTSFMGPIGIRGEYLLSSKVGFGLDLGYSSAQLSYTGAYTEYDANNNLVSTPYNHSLKTTKVGAIVTFNYHFVESVKFDAYFTTGLGYGNRTFKETSTYIGYNPAKINWPFPSFASRIGFGMRYFFTQNIGANLGLGLGQGGLVNVGITAKF